jgi:nitrate reductase gamma subunit
MTDQELSMWSFAGQILPYLAFGIFIIGTAVRIAGWMRVPVPFQLTLFPVPKTASGRMLSILSEFVFLRTLFREDRSLWLWVWLLHLSLVVVMIGHMVGIYFLRYQFILVGFSPSTSQALSIILGFVSGVVMAVSLVALLYRRITDPEVRRLTVSVKYFELLLILAIAITGLLMYAPGFSTDLTGVRAYLKGLLSVHAVPLPPAPMFTTHFFLVNVFLLYFPFSQLLHAAGFFVIRAMLTEKAPIYPAPVGTVPRSDFALKGTLDMIHIRTADEVKDP